MKKHDLEAARSWLEGYSDLDACDASDRHHAQAIQFALKFTKAALSGEVSDGVSETGYGTAKATYGYEVGAEVEHLDEAFTAMCQQLAKEIG